MALTKPSGLKATISHELKIDQSVSHSGVCLTVEAVTDGLHRVTAIDETLQKTNLGSHWQKDTLGKLRTLPAHEWSIRWAS